MVKRLFDVVVSTVLLIVVSPLLLIIAIAVKVSSSGPVFYRALRIGYKRHEFYLVKFRSMVINADKQGPAVTTAQDRRITKVGAVLRRTKLDELPQLFNVLRGEMSLVGPRPEDPRYVAYYTPDQRRVLDVRPGITGAASVQFRNEEAILSGADWESQYINKVMPAKLALDLAYVENPTLWHDLKILVQTAFALFR